MPKHEMITSLYDTANIAKHFRQINSFPTLEKDEEFTLINQWMQDGNKEALTKIVKSHMRLVAKVAKGYRGFGLPLDELIAEGHIGIMQALKHFQPNKGFRFSTYAIYWIKSALRDYIFKSGFILRFSESANYKKIFFKLKGLKNALKLNMQNRLTDQNVTDLAKTLNVDEKSVKAVEENLRTADNVLSLQEKLDEDGKENQDWINIDSNNLELSAMERDELDYRKNLLANALKTLNKTEYEVLVNRRLSDEPENLNEIASKLSISRERVRQIEISAFDKIKKHMLNLHRSNRYDIPLKVSITELQILATLMELPKLFSDFTSKF